MSTPLRPKVRTSGRRCPELVIALSSWVGGHDSHPADRCGQPFVWTKPWAEGTGRPRATGLWARAAGWHYVYLSRQGAEESHDEVVRAGGAAGGGLPSPGPPRPHESGAALPPDRLGAAVGHRLRGDPAAHPGRERARDGRPAAGLPADGPPRPPGAR